MLSTFSIFRLTFFLLNYSQSNCYQQQNHISGSLQQHQKQISPANLNQQIVKSVQSTSAAISILPKRSDTNQSQLCITSGQNYESAAMLGNYINSLNQMPNSSLSITPTKSKDKSIIDLTEEDDVVAPVSVMNNQYNNNQQLSSAPSFQISNPTSLSWNSSLAANINHRSDNFTQQIQYSTPRTTISTLVRVTAPQYASKKTRQINASQQQQSKFVKKVNNFKQIEH